MKINTYAVNCSDAWLNTEGDDISGSYVKYKDHQEVVSDLEAKCAALAAKGMELAAESAAVYGKYNETEMPDRDLVDMQTIQEMHDLCSGVKNADSFLAEVRAQGVEMFAEMYACEAIKDGDVEGWKSKVSNAASEYAAQLRQEAAK